MSTRIVVSLLFCLIAASARAQAPDHVVSAVQAVEEMLASEGEAALVGFLDEAMAPNPERDRDATLVALGRMRDELRAFDGDVAIEPAPGDKNFDYLITKKEKLGHLLDIPAEPVCPHARPGGQREGFLK